MGKIVPVKIGTITSTREINPVVKFMNGLIDGVGNDEDHELAGLLDVVGQFVEEPGQDAEWRSGVSPNVFL